MAQFRDCFYVYSFEPVHHASCIELLLFNPVGFLKSIMDDCEKVRTYSYKLTEGNSKESKLLYESDNFTAKGFSVLYTR